MNDAVDGRDVTAHHVGLSVDLLQPICAIGPTKSNMDKRPGSMKSSSLFRDQRPIFFEGAPALTGAGGGGRLLPRLTSDRCRRPLPLS